ncbi:MAG: ABC transporter ATP-binding protein [Rhodospirillaceae bacterium]|nr:ABC transporter ATP-binding protein [Rhodospirillaceae bacterium]
MYFDWRLWAFTQGARGRIAGTVALGLLAAVVGIVRLALLGWLLAAVFAGRTLNELALPIAGIALAMVLRGVIEHIRTMASHHTAARVQQTLRRRIYDKVVELGPQHFGQRRTGDVIVSLVDGVEQLETYFGQYLPTLFVAALTPLLIAGFAVFLDAYVAAALLAAALMTLFAPMVFHRLDHRNSMARSKAYKAFAADFLDSLQGLATLKAFGQSKARLALLGERAHELFRSTMWVLATNALSRGITDAGIAVGAAVALGVGAWRVTNGDASLQTLLIILMMGTEAFRPLRDLRALLHNGMVGQSAAISIFSILDQNPVVQDEAPAPAIPPSPALAFEDVVFCYPGSDEPAHRGMSFRVEAGERVGVVGASGSGKSTILKLLLRLYDPGEGAVRIGGFDVRKMDLQTLRAQMAVVSQDTHLFHGTVAENLAFGRPDASVEDMRRAAISANADEFIQRLPQGYDTVIGERGVKLSGGQRQRIAIARALLRDAPILILDEALSAVDAENEWVIQEALNRLMQGRTTLIFAHRLSSIIDCDRILVMQGGTVSDGGSHAELMQRPGVYQDLMAAQATANGTRQQSASARPDVILDAPSDVDAAVEAPEEGIIQADGLTWWQAFKVMFAEVWPWRVKLWLTLFCGVTRVMAFIGVGVAGALAVAAVKAGDPYLPYLYGLAVLAPVAGLFHWLESWIAHDMAFRMLTVMRIELFRKIDALAPAYLTRRRSGDLVAMATQDVEMVEYFFAHTLAPAFIALLVPALVLVALAQSHPFIALSLLPFLLFVAISPFLMRGRVDRLGSRTREALGELNAHAVDTVQGLAEIAAFQQEVHRGEEFHAKVREYLKIRVPFFRDLSLQHAALEVATGLGGLAVVVVGAVLVRGHAIEPNLLPMLTILAMAAFLPVSEIAHVGRQLADTLGAARRLHAVDTEPVPVCDGDEVVVANGPAGLVLEGIDFSYPGRPEKAIDGISLDIPAGTTLALVGPSGAGKTTLANLLLRFWDPVSGTIRLDGRDLRDFNLHDLRTRFALVAQDTYLFNDTLGANIRLANPDASDGDLEQAVEHAALADFIRQLPDGLETQVGERGVRLSGGQRQRVAIARAFLKDAPVLILDEATSHLDALSEQAVRTALKALMQDRTTVIIAHRLSTVRDADIIAVIDHGRLAETGSHEELLARGGLYAHLVQRQLAGMAAE